MTNLPKNWVETTLSDVAEIYDSERKPVNSSEREKRISGKEKSELYPYYGATGQVGYIDNYIFNDEFVLLGEDGAPFLEFLAKKAFIVRGKFWVNNHAHILKSKTSNKFLCFFLNQFDYHNFVTGTTRYKLTQSDMCKIPIPLPPLAEQERIVAKIEELFAGIDAGVENLKSVKNQIALYRQSVLKSAFNIKNAVIQKASEIGEVSLGRQRSPKNISKFYPTKYIRAANISENGIDVSDILDMEFLPYEKEKYLLKQNDILLSEASGSPNHVGKPAIWNNEIDDCCFQNTVIRHRLFGNHPKYVFWFYKYLYLSSFFAKLAGGVGINHIGSTKFSNIEIPIPSLDEQKRIVAEIESRFERADALETAVDRALSNAEKLKQAVLKKAFSGELVPQNPDDEPASVLLDRIRAARASELPAKKGKRK